MKIQASRTPLAAGDFVQEFEIREVLGSGGFGLVYNAYDTKLQREIALKEYFPAGISARDANGLNISALSPKELATYSVGLDRFLFEARALAQFKHAGLAEIWRFWEENGSAYIVMPKYFGSTMRDCVEKEPESCSESWLRHILIGVLAALKMLHSKNLFHRDISPDNILVLDNGDPVLLDLGATREVAEHDSEALTVTLKYGYAPIEQYSNDPQILRQGPWTDVYALCASAYFAITRKPPPTAVGRLINDTLEPLDVQQYPQFSPHFLGAIRAGLELRPEDRPQSAVVLLEALSRRMLLPSMTTAKDTPVPSIESPLVNRATIDWPAKEESAGNSTPTDPLALITLPQIVTVRPSTIEKVISPPRKDPDLHTARLDVNAERSHTPALSAVEPQLQLQSETISAASRSSAFLMPDKRFPVWWISLSILLALLLGVGWWYSQTQILKPLPPVNPVVATPLVPDAVTPAVVQPSVAPPDVSAGASQPLLPATTSLRAGPSMDPLASVRTPPSPEVIAPTAAPPVPLAPPANVEVDVMPKPAPERASLLIEVSPWGNVLVDGRERGVSPPLKRLQLVPGKYVVTLTSPGFESFTQTIELTGDQSVTVTHTFR